jgi:putative flavoprotein involved in K+ transport
LRNVCELADLKLNRLLNRIDEWAVENGVSDAVDPPHRPEPTRIEASPPLGLDFDRAGINRVSPRLLVAGRTVPVLDRKGNIRHDGGVVTEAPGVYLLGLAFLRRRKSSLIDGVGDDARDLSAHLARYLGAA